MTHQRAFAQYEEARRLMAQSRYEEALKLFEQNIQLNPHFKDLELWDECLMHLDRLTEAIVPLAAATTLNEGVRAPSLLAEVYLLLGEKHDAKRIAELALGRDPNNHKALSVKEQVANSD